MSKKNALSKIPRVEYLEVEQKALEAKVGQQPPENGTLLMSVWGFFRQSFRSTLATLLLFGGGTLAVVSILTILVNLYFGVSAGIVEIFLLFLMGAGSGAVLKGHQMEQRARLDFGRNQRFLAAKKEFPLLTPQWLIEELVKEKKVLEDGPGYFHRLHQATTKAHTKATEALEKLRERYASQESASYLKEVIDQAEKQVNRRLADVHKLEGRQGEIAVIINRMTAQANELLQKFEDLGVMKSLAELSEEVRQMLPERETEIKSEAQEIHDTLKDLRGTLDAHWRISEVEVALVSIGQGGTPEDYQDLSSAIGLYVSFKLPESE